MMLLAKYRIHLIDILGRFIGNQKKNDLTWLIIKMRIQKQLKGI
jgi:hypothetical protein